MRISLWASALLVLSTSICTAQNEYTTWYVGDGGAIEFSSGYPVSIPGKNVASLRSLGVISDPITGRVLFYTDGVDVYDSTDQLMRNGRGVGGEFVRWNSTTPPSQQFGANNVVVVPAPCDKDRYYVLTTRFLFNGLGLGPDDRSADSNEGLRYSIVDMRLNGGLGAVVEKNVRLTHYTRECIAVTLHENGRDYWVAIQLSGDSVSVIPLGCDGFGEPVIRRIPRESPIDDPPHEKDEVFWAMEFSPDGRRIALSMIVTSAWYDQGRLLICDFDPATGHVGDSIELPVVAMDVEFSPDGSKLYATGSRPSEPYLVQYDLSIENAGAILASKHSFGGYPEFRSMYDVVIESTPTGHLIVSATNSDFLSIIEQPNEKGAASEFWYRAIPLVSGKSHQRSLPNIISHKNFGKNRTCLPAAGFEVGTVTQICAGPVAVRNTALDTSGGVTWEFEGGAPGEWRGGVPPPVVWNEPGEYRITQIVGADRCVDVLRDTLVRTITVLPTPTVYAGEDIVVCTNEGVQIESAVSGDDLTYQWTPAAGLSCDDCLSPTARPSENTTYTVTVSNASGCVAVDSIRVIVDPVPLEVLMGDTLIAFGEEARMPVFLTESTQGEPLSNLQVIVRYAEGSFLPTRTESMQQWLADSELEDWTIDGWTQSATTLTLDLRHGAGGEVLRNDRPLLAVHGAMFVYDRERTDVHVEVSSPDLNCYSILPGTGTLEGEGCGADVRQILLSGVRYREATVTSDAATREVSVSFAIGIGGLVTADLYSVTGERVASLVNEVLPPGNYRITSDRAGISSGTYVLRLVCGAWSDSKVVVVQ